MAGASLIFSPAPYHILSYGTLLGTTVFHTFFNSVTSFKVLERPQFAILQRALFPIYFGMQTVLPVAMAITYPGSNMATGGLSGVFDKSNRWGVLVPLATVCLTGLVNWAYFLPVTNAITAKRRQQEKKDGKRSWDSPPHSEEMKALNKKFGQIHGLSSLVNLITVIAAVTYGFTLSSMIQ